MNNSNTLTLQILNHESLASGKHGNVLIGQEGATIGSNPDNNWSIQDPKGQIESLHAKIESIDHHFCISALAPNLYINDVDLYTKAKSVRLQHGDIITLCDFKIKVQINLQGQVYQDPLLVRPEDIISNHRDPINEILSKEITSNNNTVGELAPKASVISSLPLDPLKVLDNQYQTSATSHPWQQQTQQNYTQQQNLYSSSIDSAHTVLEQSIQLNQQPDNSLYAMENNQAHLAISPLFQGLEHTISIKDSKEAYDLLEEIGHSIKAVVEGLSSLHAASLYSSDKQLRPIEDNPLHLNLSYDETLALLYSNAKCPVHLSAPSAFAESLSQVRLHHQANQLAISEALSSLLSAFSPQALMARFMRYRRSNEKNTPDSAWAWDMYSSYYSELTSNRQQGFEKLFWEIYQQSYDRHIRQLQASLPQTGLPQTSGGKDSL